MPQITTVRLQALDAQWRTVINKYRGAAPVGLAIAHMTAESNGDTAPIIRDTQRSTGIMRIPFRVGKKYGYSEKELEDPVKNIYCWGLLTNADSQRLIRQFNKSWTKPNYDFWLSVRLLFVIGFANYEKLFAKTYPTTGDITAATDATTAGLLNWIRNDMTRTQRFGTFNYRDMQLIADELDNFTKAMTLLDGIDRIGNNFTMAPTVTPGGIDAARTARVRSTP